MAETFPARLRQPLSAIAALVSAERALLVAEIALVALLASQVARLVWIVAVPAGPLGAWSQPALPVATADPGLLGSFDPFFRASAADETTAVSSLALTLLGTRVDTVSGRGSAIIATPDGVQTSFLVGETIMPGVRLKSVEFDGVTIDRGGASERLYLDQSSGGTPITPAVLPPAATAASRLADELSITPRLSGATVTGLVLAPRGAGTAFAAAGLQPGDVLVAIDGKTAADIRDPAAALQLLGTGNASLTIERGGRPLTLTLEAPR